MLEVAEERNQEMNLKNYLTPAQVKAYATTPKKALAISKKHWWQNTQLAQKQLEKVWTTGGGDMCGLCALYDSCRKCPLGEISHCGRDGSLYQLALRANGAFNFDPTKANYKAFIEALKNMHKCLCKLEEEQ